MNKKNEFRAWKVMDREKEIRDTINNFLHIAKHDRLKISKSKVERDVRYWYDELPLTIVLKTNWEHIILLDRGIVPTYWKPAAVAGRQQWFSKDWMVEHSGLSRRTIESRISERVIDYIEGEHFKVVGHRKKLYSRKTMRDLTKEIKHKKT